MTNNLKQPTIGIIVFSTIFLTTGLLMTQVYGQLTDEPRFSDQGDLLAGHLISGCVEKRADNEIIVNNKGLQPTNAFLDSMDTNLCDIVVSSVLGADQGWYLKSVNLDEDGVHIEKILAK